MTFAFHPGAVLDGRYRLERRLGEGGMGAVWVAHQIALEREVAVKVLHAASAAMRPRLKREALALAAVHHPAIVEVYDYGESEDGAPFVVMELVRGEPLAALLARERSMLAEDAVALVLPLLDGLSAAHAAGIVHRDVKPENVLLATRAGHDGAASGPKPRASFVGETGVQPKLVDFGIAALSRGDAALTTGGSVLGTPAYMAPEQVLGQPVDARTDVWGAAVLLYELIAGARPFGFEDVFAVMRKVLSDPPPYPRSARGLDGRLWSILMDALRKDRAERTPSAAAFREALAGWLAPRSPTARAPSPALAVAVDPADPTRTAPTLIAAAPPEDAAAPSIDALIRAKLGA